MPSRANIPDSVQHVIILHGAVMAKCCQHCGRFVKGASAHVTKDHTGTSNLFRYTSNNNSAPSETAERNQEGLQLSIQWAPSASTTASASLAGVNSDQPFPEATQNAPVIDTHECMYKDVDYDFGFMGTPTSKPDANSCHTVKDLEDLEHTSSR